MFYTMRWIKLYLTCICFFKINYLIIDLSSPFIYSNWIDCVNFIYLFYSKIHVSSTDVVSFFSPHRCRLSSGRRRHAMSHFFPMESKRAHCLRFIFRQCFVLSSPLSSQNQSIKSTLGLLFEQSDSHPLFLYKSHLNLIHSPHHSTISLFYQSITSSKLHFSSSLSPSSHTHYPFTH
jgi:hypothetical protein